MTLPSSALDGAKNKAQTASARCFAELPTVPEFCTRLRTFPYVRQSTPSSTTPTRYVFHLSSALQIAMGCTRLAPLSERDTAPLFDKS
jgi:hypothetical protein